MATQDAGVNIQQVLDALRRVRDPKSGQTWELNTLTNEIGLVDQPDGLTVLLPTKEPFVLRRKGQDVFTVTRGLRSRAG